MSVQKPREIAARILQRWERSNDYLDSLLGRELGEATLSPADRGLLHELACGVIRWRALLDWLIERKTSGRTQKLALQVLLRLGLYQMFWLDRIPDHAAINESVELAKRLGCGPQSGFVNAVLRDYARERENVQKLIQEMQRTQLPLGYSHPRWLCDRWEPRCGQDNLRKLLEWNNTPPVIFGRVNYLRIDADKLRSIWKREGVEFSPRSWDWTGEDSVYQLDSHPPLDRLQSFSDGLFYVQDPSTLLAVRELSPQPGEAVLDMCAAPGGKTTFIAQMMKNLGRIVAQDAQLPRLKLVRENCDRLGVTCVETSRASDAVLPELNRRFDRILVDAPCSNTGVMRRRVDLRWRIRPEEIARLAGLQLDLLLRVAPLLKPDGALVYSTCSLEPEENQEVVNRFLAQHPDFRIEIERELFPFVDGVDGAYVARLRHS